MLSDFFRINLPYGMVRNSDNHWMAFNREYKPIGFNTDEPVDTKSKKSPPVHTSFIGLSNNFIMKLTGYNEDNLKRDEQGNICQFWLYNDATNPMNQPNENNDHWPEYWRKLEELAKLRIIR